jgi:hypothetical protein
MPSATKNIAFSDFELKGLAADTLWKGEATTLANKLSTTKRWKNLAFTGYPLNMREYRCKDMGNSCTWNRGTPKDLHVDRILSK